MKFNSIVMEFDVSEAVLSFPVLNPEKLRPGQKYSAHLLLDKETQQGQIQKIFDLIEDLKKKIPTEDTREVINYSFLICTG